MGENKIIRIFEGVTLLIVIGTLVLSLTYNNAFVPSFMLMSSLFIFEVCYETKGDKKELTCFLFVLGVLLIFGSLMYTFMRLI